MSKHIYNLYDSANIELDDTTAEYHNAYVRWFSDPTQRAAAPESPEYMKAFEEVQAIWNKLIEAGLYVGNKEVNGLLQFVE